MFRWFHGQTWSLLVIHFFFVSLFQCRSWSRMISEIHRNTQRLIVWCCLQSSCGRLSSQVASPLHCRIWRKAIVVESIHARACNSEHRSIPQHCSAARAACTRTCLECFGAPAWDGKLQKKQIEKDIRGTNVASNGIKAMPWSFHCHSDRWDFLPSSKGMTRLLDISELEGEYQIISNHSEIRSGCNRQVTRTQARNPQKMGQKVALLSDFGTENPDNDFVWFQTVSYQLQVISMLRAILFTVKILGSLTDHLSNQNRDESLEAFNHLHHAVCIACTREHGKGMQKKSKEVRICPKHSETLPCALSGLSRLFTISPNFY